MTSPVEASHIGSSTCTNKLDKFEDLEFKWGKRRGIGGKRKEVQFYESFTYDGVEYALQDCVYMHKDGEPEPYIGKLIKIWENGDKSKKVKVQWFFRPSEILYHLKDEKFMENEIFLSTGEGIGLSNVNSLEAIAGKCNVVCISEDSSNRQPSEEELKVADYVFYRAFDVGRCTLDMIGERVGGLEVNFVFNRNESEKASDVVKLPKDRTEDRQNSSSGLKIEKGNKNLSDLVLKKNERDVMPGDGNVLSSELGSITKTKSIVEPIEDSKVTTKILMEENVFADKMACSSKVKDEKDDGNNNNCKPYENTTHIKDSGALDTRASKRIKLDSTKLLEYKDSNNNKRSSPNDTKPQVEGVAAFVPREKTVHVKDPSGQGKDVKSGKDSGFVVDRPSKKAKIDVSARICKDRNKRNVQQLNAKSGENEDKVMAKAVNFSDEKMSRASECSAVLDNDLNGNVSSLDDTKSLINSAPPAAVDTKSKAEHVRHSIDVGKDDNKKTKAVHVKHSIDMGKDDNTKTKAEHVKHSCDEGQDDNAKTKVEHVEHFCDTGKDDNAKTKAVHVKHSIDMGKDDNTKTKAEHVKHSCYVGKDDKTKTKAEHVKHSYDMGKDDKRGKDSVVVKDRTLKETKVDNFDEISRDGNCNVHKPSIKHGENAAKVSLKSTYSVEGRAIVPKTTFGLGEGLPKAKSSMKPNKLSNSNMPSSGVASRNDEIEDFGGKSFEVTPQRVAESVSWYKEQSWEERLQTANDQGKLVLFQNLDPGFTSAEVEDIIWHAFKEKCSAKMIQRIAFSGPNSGQALAIFKTREAAERVTKKLDNRYLMVSNQRPLVAEIIALPKSQRSKSSFVGHICIDKIRHQSQREMKEAVSTSHCSQPNTIEHEMAMEWRVLQARSEFTLKRLYKSHREELRTAAAKLKSK